jgi:hypothetical protein
MDSVFEQHARDAALIRELELKLLYTLDTHCHADHVTGAWLMKVALGSKVGLSLKYEAENVDLPLAHGDTVSLRRSLTRGPRYARSHGRFESGAPMGPHEILSLHLVAREREQDVSRRLTDPRERETELCVKWTGAVGGFY